MRPINAVLAHHNAISALRLAETLKREFRNLAVAGSRQEVRSAVARLRAPFAVLDLEMLDMVDVKELCREFPNTAFVCVHRLADDRMWSEALACGAVDCCHPDDLRGILLASDRYVVLSRSHAAAA